jgi:hypothetical protein
MTSFWKNFISSQTSKLCCNKKLRTVQVTTLPDCDDITQFDGT